MGSCASPTLATARAPPYSTNFSQRIMGGNNETHTLFSTLRAHNLGWGGAMLVPYSET